MDMNEILETFDFAYEKLDNGLYKLIDMEGYFDTIYCESFSELIEALPQAVIKDYVLSKETFETEEDFETLEDVLEYCKKHKPLYVDVIKALIDPSIVKE